MAHYFTQWFAEKVAKQLLNGKHTDNIEIDLSSKRLKQPFCRFLSNAARDVEQHDCELTRAWVDTGLSQVWGPNGSDLHLEAKAMEERDELFGGQLTKITIGGAAMGSSSAACAKASAKPAPKPAPKKAAADSGSCGCFR